MNDDTLSMRGTICEALVYATAARLISGWSEWRGLYEVRRGSMSAVTHLAPSHVGPWLSWLVRSCPHESPRPKHWDRLLDALDQLAKLTAQQGSTCAINRPQPAPVTGTLTTGPGYREVGDYESSYLAPRSYFDCPRAENWYESAIGLPSLLGATVPVVLEPYGPTVRGTFTVTVTFQPDPYTDEPTCAIPYERDECRQPYRGEGDAPLDLPNPCPPHADPSACAATL